MSWSHCSNAHIYYKNWARAWQILQQDLLYTHSENPVRSLIYAFPRRFCLKDTLLQGMSRFFSGGVWFQPLKR